MADKPANQVPQPEKAEVSTLKKADDSAPIEAEVVAENVVENVAESDAAAAPEATAETVGDAGAGAQHAAATETLQADLEALQAALAAAKDQTMRAKAETQNIRRRAELDVEKAHKFALEKFTSELLPVVDSLERAIDSARSAEASAEAGAEAGAEAIRQGVELTLSMFVAALKKFNVEPVDPQGEPFDPQHHQAMSMVENAEVEPNTVLHVMQKGYLLNGRLVRPAMVMVSKAAPKIDEQA